MTTMQAANPLEQFQWQRQPKAEVFVREMMDEMLSQNEYAMGLARRMNHETGTRFYDWISYIWLAHTDARVKRIEEVGYSLAANANMVKAYENAQGIFPTIAVAEYEGASMESGLKVDSVADFLATHK